MRFSFLSGRETTAALFVVTRMQENYKDKYKKFYMCFVDTEKVFNRVPKKVMERAMKKNYLKKLQER